MGAGRVGQVLGNDEFRFEVVGESYYQDAIEAAVGGREEDSVQFYCDALLIPDPANQYDPNAVRVEIAGRTVGHLARASSILFNKALAAKRLTAATCEAVIVGGWDRGGNDRGSFGVRLNAMLPFELTAPGARPSRPAPAASPASRSGGLRRDLYLIAMLALLAWSIFVFGEGLFIWWVVANDPDGSNTQQMLKLDDAMRALMFPGGRPIAPGDLSIFITSMWTTRIINWAPIAIVLGLFALLLKPRRT